MPDDQTVKTILTQTTIVQAPEDAELGGRVRELVHRALDEVDDILSFGAPSDKLVVIKSLLGPAGRLIGAGATSQREEARLAFEGLMAEIRDVPIVTTLVTDEGEQDVELTAALAATHHQDEGDGTEEIGRDDW